MNGNIKLTGVTPTYKLTNLATPTADSDAATKLYADTHSGGNLYVGNTSTFCTGGYYGNLGATGVCPVPPMGLTGMNQVCQQAFPTTPFVHACSWDDIFKSPGVAGSGWVVDGAYLGVQWNGSSNDNIQYPRNLDGTASQNQGGNSTINCAGWTSNSGSDYGPHTAGGKTLTMVTCSTAKHILCCR